MRCEIEESTPLSSFQELNNIHLFLYLYAVEDLLDETGETRINHSRRIGLILIVSCLACIAFIVAGENSLFDYFDSKLPIIMTAIGIPVMTSIAAILCAYPANIDQVKHLDLLKTFYYSLLPFGFLFVFVCFLFIDEIKTSRFTSSDYIEILSVFIPIGCIPSSIIFSIIKARSLYLLNKAWVYIIPLCIIIVATLSIGLYFIVQYFRS